MALLIFFNTDGTKVSDLCRYEAYYNNWLGGKYIWRIDEMHKQYGPIIRISPNNLHVGDPVSCLKVLLKMLLALSNWLSRTSTMFSIQAHQTTGAQTKKKV